MYALDGLALFEIMIGKIVNEATECCNKILDPIIVKGETVYAPINRT